MRRSILLLAGALLLGGTALARPVLAQDSPEPPRQNWSFDGIFGTYDEAAAQRGFQVYKEVCSNCHSMKFMHYRDLAGIGVSADQIKAIAASVDVPTLNDSGEPATRPGTPADVFKSPFANDLAAKAANNGALPPDQTLLVDAREDGPNYIDALLQGYSDPPKGVAVPDGLYYNKYFPGHMIHMPPPLQNGQVTYADGTPATVAQMSHDVVTFLAYTSNPEMVQRKQTGVKIVLFLVFLTGLTYATKRKIWAKVH